MAKERAAGDLLDRVIAEIEERLSKLRPLVEEHEQLLAAAASLAVEEDAPVAVKRRGRPAGKKAVVKARRTSVRAERAVGKRQGPRSATQQAIEAALEHGSHTLSELVLVTAIEGAPIRAQLSRLQKAGVVSRVRRDGKMAYSLLSAAAAASSGPRKGASAK